MAASCENAQKIWRSAEMQRREKLPVAELVKSFEGASVTRTKVLTTSATVWLLGGLKTT
ncbi:hypothetical protein Rcae01_00350 [Novipirellula caenicola]|uniref:Uncharacterized protein n=1 Tax=Novipirellula caenicola TaxID=1536901 RepID=A0ABP9VJE7_9BACT